MESPARIKDKKRSDTGKELEAVSSPPVLLRVVDGSCWDEFYQKTSRPSLLQDILYARAAASHSGMTPQCRLIEKPGGLVAGLALTLERRALGGLLHHVALDHGPLWLPGHGGLDDMHAFAAAFVDSFPARPGRRRRVIPAVPDMPAYRGLLAGAGLRRRPGATDQTFWIDLTTEEDRLLCGLRKNWRAQLAVAGRAGLRLEWDDRGRTLDWLIAQEGATRRHRAYHGPSPGLLRALAGQYGPRGRMLTGRALLAGRPVAGVLLVIHPPAATYILGWAGDAGRACGAQNKLLWDGLLILKARDIRYFDLGGVNDGPAGGVKYFKEGMGGELVTQPGLYS